jgi:chromate transporter
LSSLVKINGLFRELTNNSFYTGFELSRQSISQILPGANIANLSVFVGQKLRGPLGATVALLGLLTAPFFAVIALASTYGQLKTLPNGNAETALDGVAAAAIDMILVVVGKGAQRAARRPAAFIAFVATFATVGLLHWPLLAVVVVVGPLSVLAAWLRRSTDA